MDLSIIYCFETYRRESSAMLLATNAERHHPVDRQLRSLATVGNSHFVLKERKKEKLLVIPFKVVGARRRKQCYLFEQAARLKSILGGLPLFICH